MVPHRYHRALVVLHWLLAAMILFSLAMGMLSLVDIPNSSPDKLFALRGHMVAGIVILVLMLVRLAVRLATPRPAPAPTGIGLLDALAPLVHFAFYLVVVLMALSGIALAVQAGLPAIVFGGSGAPLPETFAGFTPRVVHGVLARILLVLVVLHVLGALYHQFVRRDQLLSRMKIGKAA
jgi:cytochrome b561